MLWRLEAKLGSSSYYVDGIQRALDRDHIQNFVTQNGRRTD